MQEFKYRAMLRNGKIVRGKMAGKDKRQIIVKLRAAKIEPIVVKKLKIKKKKVDVPKKTKNVASFKNLKKKDKKINFKNLLTQDISLMGKVKSYDIIVFVNNLYILKRAGFNNIQALEALYEGTENPKFKDIIEDLLIGVQSGEKLYSLMENYPKIFSPMFINFIKVGETSGTLEAALLHARDYIEESEKLKKTIRKILIPRILQFVALIILIFVGVLAGVPIIQSVYDMFGSSRKIPVATQIAYDASIWLKAYWYIPTSIIAIIGILFYIIIHTPKGKYDFDKFKIKAAGFGPLIKNITVSKFFKAMLLNLRNGMRIQESIEVSKGVTNNYYFLSVAEIAKNNSLIGESWITPFEENEIFKPMVTQMVSIGMQSDLPAMMSKVNEYLEAEIDESLEKFKKWLPEIAYSILGIALIAFTLVIIVPIIQVYMGDIFDEGVL